MNRKDKPSYRIQFRNKPQEGWRVYSHPGTDKPYVFSSLLAAQGVLKKIRRQFAYGDTFIEKI